MNDQLPADDTRHLSKVERDALAEFRRSGTPTNHEYEAFLRRRESRLLADPAALFVAAWG